MLYAKALELGGRDEGALGRGGEFPATSATSTAILNAFCIIRTKTA